MNMTERCRLAVGHDGPCGAVNTSKYSNTCDHDMQPGKCLRCDLDDARAQVDALTAVCDRMRTIVDEEVSLQPVLPMDDLLTVLERHLFESRQERERYRAAVDQLRRMAQAAEITAAQALQPQQPTGERR